MSSSLIAVVVAAYSNVLGGGLVGLGGQNPPWEKSQAPGILWLSRISSNNTNVTDCTGAASLLYNLNV